jgi:2-dehydropantoate 2-reductase
MLTVYGAGAVGLVIGARLARAGHEVLFVTRRSEVAERIERDGVLLEDPASGESWRPPARAVAGVQSAGGRIGEGPVLFCMRGTQTPAAAEALAEAASRAVVVSMQNDVDNEAELARHFERVVGAVVRQTCTRTGPNAAVATGAGRLVLGDWPEGVEPHTQALAQRLREAGYSVGLSQRVAEDLWLKLCLNLMSAANALIRREDHTTRAFVEIKVRLLEEARAVLDAAVITARPCDGEDRSLEAEILHQRRSLEEGTSARRLPLHNQVWSALRDGGPLEADRYHRRILDLARRHGVAAPMNTRLLHALERCDREGRGPERLAAAELL